MQLVSSTRFLSFIVLSEIYFSLFLSSSLKQVFFREDKMATSNARLRSSHLSNHSGRYTSFLMALEKKIPGSVLIVLNSVTWTY